MCDHDLSRAYALEAELELSRRREASARLENDHLQSMAISQRDHIDRLIVHCRRAGAFGWPAK